MVSLGGVWYGEGAGRGGGRDDIGKDGTCTANDDGGEIFVPLLEARGISAVGDIR